MRISLLLALGLFLSTCTTDVEDLDAETPEKDATNEEEASPIAGGGPDEPLDEETLRLLSEASEIERKLKAGEPITEDEIVSDLSAYQRGQIERRNLKERRRPAWLLLARQSYSESLNDMEALLQLDLNLAEAWGVSLPEAIKKRAPHVSREKDFTRERQKMTSTLPGWGNEPGELWWECEEWEQTKSGRWIGLPDGCHGAWKNTLPRWKKVRAKAKAIINTRPTVVKGHPLDQGGLMDMADYLKRNPHMCLLDSPGTSNYYFGRRDDPRNVCIEPTEEMLASSRKMARRIDRRDKRRGEGKYANSDTVSAREISRKLNELDNTQVR